MKIVQIARHAQNNLATQQILRYAAFVKRTDPSSFHSLLRAAASLGRAPTPAKKYRLQWNAEVVLPYQKKSTTKKTKHITKEGDPHHELPSTAAAERLRHVGVGVCRVLNQGILLQQKSSSQGERRSSAADVAHHDDVSRLAAAVQSHLQSSFDGKVLFTTVGEHRRGAPFVRHIVFLVSHIELDRMTAEPLAYSTVCSRHRKTRRSPKSSPLASAKSADDDRQNRKAVQTVLNTVLPEMKQSSTTGGKVAESAATVKNEEDSSRTVDALDSFLQKAVRFLHSSGVVTELLPTSAAGHYHYKHHKHRMQHSSSSPTRHGIRSLRVRCRLYPAAPSASSTLHGATSNHREDVSGTTTTVTVTFLACPTNQFVVQQTLRTGPPSFLSKLIEEGLPSPFSTSTTSQVVPKNYRLSFTDGLQVAVHPHGVPDTTTTTKPKGGACSFSHDSVLQWLPHAVSSEKHLFGVLKQPYTHPINRH